MKNNASGINFKKLNRFFRRYWMYYFFLLPALVYLAIFSYAPMYGIQIAFKRFTPGLGVTGSPWVGFQHFTSFFNSYQFWTLLTNTLAISVYTLLASAPMPVILALLLHYCILTKFKKITQTITYAPYFISTVVMVAIVMQFLSPHYGIINFMIQK